MLLQSFRKVFGKPRYAFLALTASFITLAIVVLLPNISLIGSVMSHPGIPLSNKLALPILLLGSIATNFTAFSAFYTIVTAVLVGVNVAFIVYIVGRQRSALPKTGAAAGAVGVISGIFGAGCAACGSVILTSILATSGGAGILAFLPLRGGEFGVLGAIILGLTTYLLAKQITKPLTC